jgi:RHS repeat-associated protein
MRRVLTALLVLVGLLPATLHAAPVSTYSATIATTDVASSYFGGRYYASQLGRLTTVDPFFDIDGALVDPQRWNRYTYVGNNPLRYVDPFGLYQFEVTCGSGDDQCLENQRRFRDSLASIRKSANQLELGSAARNDLERVLRSIGETEGSGATIVFGGAGSSNGVPNLGRINDLKGQITLNLQAIDSWANRFSTSSGTALSATIAHEGRHLSNPMLQFWTWFDEIRPLTSESYFYQGIGMDDPARLLWDNRWLALSPAEGEVRRRNGVRAYDRWIKTGVYSQ